MSSQRQFVIPSNSVVKDGAIDLSDVGLTEEQIKNISQIYIVACGSAYHVGVACSVCALKIWQRFQFAWSLHLNFVTAKWCLIQMALVIIVSQSGETADSLAALRLAKKKGVKTLGNCQCCWKLYC